MTTAEYHAAKDSADTPQKRRDLFAKCPEITRLTMNDPSVAASINAPLTKAEIEEIVKRECQVSMGLLAAVGDGSLSETAMTSRDSTERDLVIHSLVLDEFEGMPPHVF